MATAGIPESLKSIRPFLLVAKEHDTRDPVIAYFCRCYAVEIAVKMKDRPPEVTGYLVSLMDQLESQKKTLLAQGNEAVSNDLVASAHVENYALKLFSFADTEDRKGVSNKAVVKSFHTASILFDVMQTFGELTEEIIQSRKYAKWKATYIHGCLKRGETPVPGPAGWTEGAEGGAPALPHPSTLQPGPPAPGAPMPGGAYPPVPGNPAAAYPPPQQPSTNQLAPGVPPGQHAPPSTPDQGAYQAGMPGPSTGSVQLQQQDFDKAQKFCKFAVSALQYEDVPAAIDNLEKALRLLRTGRE
ncbi:vacuolar protein sorting-associated protein VTA1 homolog [Diadema setosum]|uniref:vacuolar protein sorting-associated protein VTA1 homolog n=1 Tax=Diadema setosum TaxID=31175 RepID=UPI003B3BAD67